MSTHSSMEVEVLPNADLPGSHIGHTPMTAPLVELCHRRLIVFSVAATMALGVEIFYAKLEPKLPQLYAVLLRAAVWDCVLVGVLVAQLTDISPMPIVAGTDGSHFFPLAVMLYHVLVLLVCIGNDLLDRMRNNSPSRALHRSLVFKRVLLELAGGARGSRLGLGRACFLVSIGAMWFIVRALILMGDGSWAFSMFLVTLFVAYGAAGFAALELRRTLPGNLVQWLCTGWGVQDTILKGPIKLLGIVFLFPFALSVIVAQIWLRAVVFLVWIVVACPCCRLKRGDDVYDAFGREVALPLLQCSFLAFASSIAVLILARVNGHLIGMHYVLACSASLYYTGMLLAWTAPMVLRIKVGFEEALEAVPSVSVDEGDDASRIELLGGNLLEGEGVDIEELKSNYEEVRALLYRERHDHTVEVMQLQDKMNDAELRTRLTQRNLQGLEKARKELEEKVKHLESELAECKNRSNVKSVHVEKVVGNAESSRASLQQPLLKPYDSARAIPTQPEPEPRSSEPKASLADLLPLAAADNGQCVERHLSEHEHVIDLKSPSAQDENARTIVVVDASTQAMEVEETNQDYESDEEVVSSRIRVPEAKISDRNDIVTASALSPKAAPFDHIPEEQDRELHEEVVTEPERERISEGSLSDSSSSSSTRQCQGKCNTEEAASQSHNLMTREDKSAHVEMDNNTIQGELLSVGRESQSDVEQEGTVEFFDADFDSEADAHDVTNID